MSTGSGHGGANESNYVIGKSIKKQNFLQKTFKNFQAHLFPVMSKLVLSEKWFTILAK